MSKVNENGYVAQNITITVKNRGKKSGITYELLDHVKSIGLKLSEGTVNKTEWNQTLNVLQDINETRIAQNKGSIFGKNFAVKTGQKIDFSAEEMDKIYTAMGVEIANPQETAGLLTADSPQTVVPEPELSVQPEPTVQPEPSVQPEPTGQPEPTVQPQDTPPAPQITKTNQETPTAEQQPATSDKPAATPEKPKANDNKSNKNNTKVTQDSAQKPQKPKTDKKPQPKPEPSTPKTHEHLAQKNGGIDQKRTARNKNAAGDITYHKDGSVTISKRVDQRIQEMAATLKTDSTSLKGVLFAESGFELNGKGKAAGLNQLTNDGLSGFNKTYGTNFDKKDIRNMNTMQQLDVAEASLQLSKQQAGFGENQRISGGQLFAMNLYPANAGKNTVLSASQNSRAYRANKGLDFNGDGKVTIDEFTKAVNNKAKYVHTDDSPTET